MYICLCHGITEAQIRVCIEAGARTLTDLQGQLGIATQCGSCVAHACEMLEDEPALGRRVGGCSQTVSTLQAQR